MQRVDWNVRRGEGAASDRERQDQHGDQLRVCCRDPLPRNVLQHRQVAYLDLPGQQRQRHGRLPSGLQRTPTRAGRRLPVQVIRQSSGADGHQVIRPAFYSITAAWSDGAWLWARSVALLEPIMMVSGIAHSVMNI